jgi:hypothetical protein
VSVNEIDAASLNIVKLKIAASKAIYSIINDKHQNQQVISETKSSKQANQKLQIQIIFLKFQNFENYQNLIKFIQKPAEST